MDSSVHIDCNHNVVDVDCTVVPDTDSTDSNVVVGLVLDVVDIRSRSCRKDVEDNERLLGGIHLTSTRLLTTYLINVITMDRGYKMRFSRNGREELQRVRRG